MGFIVRPCLKGRGHQKLSCFFLPCGDTGQMAEVASEEPSKPQHPDFGLPFSRSMSRMSCGRVNQLVEPAHTSPLLLPMAGSTTLAPCGQAWYQHWGLCSETLAVATVTSSVGQTGLNSFSVAGFIRALLLSRILGLLRVNPTVFSKWFVLPSQHQSKAEQNQHRVKKETRHPV